MTQLRPYLLEDIMKDKAISEYHPGCASDAENL
jgi:hypothetical protein